MSGRDPQSPLLQTGATTHEFEASTADAGETAPAKGAAPSAGNVRVQYEQTGVQFANRVMVQAGRDQLILSFAPNPIPDPRTGGKVLSVQSRIAMTPAGAARLVQSLQTALQKSGYTGE